VSPRSILTLVATGVIAVAVGGAAIVGATASGAPHVPAAAPAASIPQKPAPVLHLPSTLNLVTQTDGLVKIDATHQVFTNAVTHPSAPAKIIGTASLTCTGVNGTTPREVCNGAISLRGGTFLITETLDISTATVTGNILAGAGTYAGATGYVNGHDKGGGKTTLTLNYSLG
jgi:hypothetical protein